MVPAEPRADEGEERVHDRDRDHNGREKAPLEACPRIGPLVERIVPSEAPQRDSRVAMDMTFIIPPSRTSARAC